MKKKINENSTRSPYKKRKQSKEKEKKTGMPRKCKKKQNNFNTKYNLICTVENTLALNFVIYLMRYLL